MITNVSELLKGFMDVEREKLDSYALKHAPTIGKMYEGLTSDVLDRAIPLGLDLQITHGVIHDGAGNMTGEIDCMLVKNLGEEIPHTNSHKCHIKDVIAVLEVKKNLYSSDLKDSFEHLRDVSTNNSSYIQNPENKNDEGFDINPAIKAFSETTGIIPPPHHEVSKMGFEKELLYHSFVTELTSPIRIVLGYHGFKTESGLRKGLIKFIREGEKSGNRGFGTISFPQLIICGNNSLVKMNGFPYVVPMTSNYWDFYVSSNSNPILLILEFIWTRLNLNNSIWGDDLALENFQLLLSAKPEKSGDKFGWRYNYLEIKEKDLKARKKAIEWKPFIATQVQFIMFQRLCNEEYINIDEQSFIDSIKKEGETSKSFVESLTNSGLVALNENRLELTTLECACVILPTGEYAVAENNSGRLSRWLESKFSKDKKT